MRVSSLIWRKKLMDSISGNLGYAIILAVKGGRMATQQPLQFGAYRLDGANGPLWRHTRRVKLPPKAVAVLWCLATSAGSS